MVWHTRAELIVSLYGDETSQVNDGVQRRKEKFIAIALD